MLKPEELRYGAVLNLDADELNHKSLLAIRYNTMHHCWSVILATPLKVCNLAFSDDKQKAIHFAKLLCSMFECTLDEGIDATGTSDSSRQ